MVQHPPAPGTLSATLAAKALRQTVCRLPGGALAGRGRVLPAPAMAPAQRLLELVAELRSPAGGWPSHLPQTPENLVPYVADELAELLEALPPTMDPPSVAMAAAPQLMTVAELVPRLLWRIASSGYEAMQLVEGLRARLYHAPGQFQLQVVRLVPLLALTTEGGTVVFDLVTQGPPQVRPLAADVALQLVDNDGDDPPVEAGELLEQLRQQMGQCFPVLNDLMGDGWTVECLGPGQRWQRGQLRLRFVLTAMESHRERVAVAPASPAPDAVPTGGAFTIDDFADTLGPVGVSGQPIMADWLTFTDDEWVQAFLGDRAREALAVTLPPLLVAAALPDVPSDEPPDIPADHLSAARELACMTAVYGATTPIMEDSALFSHTFVHGSVLVADLWPRLRWYLAQSSERLMQLMGGVTAEALQPGLTWQNGNLFLRPLLALEAGSERWCIDLSHGHLLTGKPFGLVPEAIVTMTPSPFGPSPCTVAQLYRAVQADLQQQVPALVALRQGTPINLHRVESGEGCQAGQLQLEWLFTLQTMP